jgi:hypothetical protein
MREKKNPWVIRETQKLFSLKKHTKELEKLINI